jgi:hypothetical protein
MFQFKPSTETNKENGEVKQLKPDEHAAKVIKMYEGVQL